MTAEQFKERFIQIYPKLFAVAVANLGNSEEAKDVMQSLYLKLWERRDELIGVENDIGYCRVVLLNICRNKWRDDPEWAGEMYDVSCDGHSNFETDDLKEKIEQFVARLPEKQRRIITMRMQGAATDEIVEATGLSAENVRTIISRTRQLIRDFYNRING